ncbi:alpha-E domain-containing protein [Kocuria coralli]|uniref:Alpha-E domain-containing protein n=1 Tax=Kocuria coralli TaxID=1461025 RepID=A0A5J5KU07_9MICC|nr:alpha-E domain-containing protein [Kocuria coralli]KAA9393133.1 alpha-E domain-containing protein [Kocuria coralli]
MLSRIAESLFWIGRYMERADGVSRILDVHLERITQLPEAEQSQELRRIMDVMGAPSTDENPDVGVLIHELAWNRQSKTSIAGSVNAARENARRAREIVSSKMWEAVNSTYYGLNQHRHDVVGTFRMCQWAAERISTIRGQAEMTMSHDQSWQFLTLGVTLERADMTARLLWTRTSGLSPSAETSWVDILHCAGAYEAFLRTRNGSFNDESAVRFLLLDRLFPRSIIYSLTHAERILEALDPGSRRMGFTNDARRIIGRARAELEFLNSENITRELPKHLNEVQAAVASTAEFVTDKYFTHEQESSWFGGVL